MSSLPYPKTERGRAAQKRANAKYYQKNRERILANKKEANKVWYMRNREAVLRRRREKREAAKAARISAREGADTHNDPEPS
jgi:hypothetical protein